MADDSFHYSQTYAKQHIVSGFIKHYLGYEPGKEVRRKFTIKHRLNETHIYFEGVLIAHLRYYLKGETFFIEYL